MTEACPNKTISSSETLRDILFFIAWGAILCLCALTLKSYYLAGKPPLWDNLVYQQNALNILTNWLDGDLEKPLKILYTEKAPAYLLAIASSFFLFGFNPYSPYLVSAFFGVGCMIAVYLLGQELGIGKRMNFWCVIFLSLLPNFIYQNFLQTRNDFPLAFFITLSWVFLLRGIKRKDIKLAFFAGIIAGIATLFKTSAPGYIFWGILTFLLLPEKYIQIGLRDRMKLAFLFVGGAVLSCGWHFLPNLRQILSYYTIWANAKALVASQYNLQGNWTDYFFYLKNIFYVHLGEKISIVIILVCGILLIRWSIIKRSIKITEKHSKESSLIFLVLMAGIFPIIFISIRQSFSSLGDVPVLPLVASGSLAFMSRISCGITAPKFLLSSLLPACLVLSISNLPIIEKQFPVKDIEKFSYATMEIRKKFGLSNTPMMQVFSHPIYNIDSLSWLWLMNPETDRGFVHEKSKIHQITFPEDGKIIASKLASFPLLILSDYSGTLIKGEVFHTFNRLHSEINSALKKEGQFLKVGSVDLEDGQFSMHFMLNKNYSTLRPTKTNTEGWVEWGREIHYFSYRKSKLIWRGIPIHKLDSFRLIDKDNQASSIQMTLNQIFPNGKHEYQSKMIPATDKLIKFIVMPESSDSLLPTTNIEKRMHAFNQVETEVIKYD